jgi:copper chaperone CopZ
MSELKLKIEGMTCGGCANSISKVLSTMAGSAVPKSACKTSRPALFTTPRRCRRKSWPPRWKMPVLMWWPPSKGMSTRTGRNTYTPSLQMPVLTGIFIDTATVQSRDMK